MNKLINYFKESYDELRNKVSWPTMAELQQTTVLVLVGIVIIALVILVMDGGVLGLLKLTVYSTPKV